MRVSGYPGGYCTVPVGTAAVPVMWVLQMGTAGYCGYCRVLWVLWVLRGLKVTVGYCASTRGYCRVLWVLWVLQEMGTVGTAGVNCRVLHDLLIKRNERLVTVL